MPLRSQRGLEEPKTHSLSLKEKSSLGPGMVSAKWEAKLRGVSGMGLGPNSGDPIGSVDYIKMTVL